MEMSGRIAGHGQSLPCKKAKPGTQVTIDDEPIVLFVPFLVVRELLARLVPKLAFLTIKIYLFNVDSTLNSC